MSTSARRVEAFGTTIFSEINELALKHQALNLGQGRPDFDTPPDIVQALVEAAQSGSHNQYAPGFGVPALREAVANHAARHYGLSIDPAHVIITAGATEGIFASILGLVDPGDEVIVLEPFYDSYVPNILMAGATPVFVPLHPPTWTIDPDELRAAFSKKTRALILNSPHNPTGRVFTHAELTLIAELCIEHDVTVISDEVYEHLTYSRHPENVQPSANNAGDANEARYIPIMTLPGMFERTVAISSGGKTFSATGWKIGWVYGHPDLVQGVLRAHQFITFAVHHPSQLAIAHALNLSTDFYRDLHALYQGKLDLLMTAMEGSGLKFRAPEGTYFIMADFSDVFPGVARDFAFHLIKEIGLAAIPPESLYSPQHVHFGNKYIRFSFCKTDEALILAKEKFALLASKVAR
jgi:N-succinyldiaminopimelate aminotransferase